MKMIINNLYLGDRKSAPRDSELIISCAEEMYIGDNEVKFNQTGKVTYVSFEDYPYNLDINLVRKAVNEIENNVDTKKVYVHCLWGINRSASLVFMYMVRSKNIIADSYEEAQKQFWKIYPNHSPNPGWKSFLKTNYPYNF
ncbi:dual specificity protein phosphatase [Spiroplasma endosymbiont of Othius punctulatus]|uniref:dual specificity protein phosphatase family protein n=1 Tax=Spiroplasma endosymbiont of Othius punctulatus TaxID=3066289 RepID=UPI0030D4D68A